MIKANIIKGSVELNKIFMYRYQTFVLEDKDAPLYLSIGTMYCVTTAYDIKRILGCELVYRNAALDILSSDSVDAEKLNRMSFIG